MSDIVEFVLKYYAGLPARTLKNFAGTMVYLLSAHTADGGRLMLRSLWIHGIILIALSRDKWVERNSNTL